MIRINNRGPDVWEVFDHGGEAMMKDLFFPVTGAASDLRALDAATQLASLYSARLIVSVPAAAPMPMGSTWGVMPGMMLSEMITLVEREAKQRAEDLRARLGNADARWEVRVDEANLMEPARNLAAQARYADVSIISRPDGNDAAIAHAYFHAFLFESGRPVLVLPPNPHVRPIERVVLAWRPTREATRAMHDALALFSPSMVDIVVVNPEIGPGEHGPDPGVDMAAHLVRHGVEVNIRQCPSTKQHVAERVLLHATEVKADLVVAGGYGHGRMREWAVGGATRELLERLETPVLFAH